MRKQYTRAELQPTFEETYDQKPELGGGLKGAECLVRLVAQVLDEAVRGSDCFLSIGITRKGDAAVVTLSLNGDKQFATGADWPSLMASVESLV